MSIDLEAIEARVNAATPGPWEYDYAGCVSVYNGNDELMFDICECEDICTENAEANGEFIAHAREDIPALLAEVKRQDERIELLSAIIDAYIEICDKNRSTIAKLMEAYQSVTAERDAEKARADKAEAERDACKTDFEACMRGDKERCAYCLYDDDCEPGESRCYANVCGFEWSGAGKEQNDDT